MPWRPGEPPDVRGAIHQSLEHRVRPRHAVPELEGQPVRGRAQREEPSRVAFNQPSQAEQRELLLPPLGIRIRDVVQGPDGALYGATEKVSDGNNLDGQMLRIEPAD